MAKVTGVPVAIGQDGEELYDKYCVSCKLKRQLVDGLYHCKICGVLCEECARQHPKVPKKKKHWATRMEMLEAPTRGPTFKYLDKCEIHPANKIVAYCLEDGLLLCNDCIAMEHENCGIETIEKLSENANKEEDIRKGRVTVQDLKNRNNRVAKQRRKEMIDVASQSEKFSKYIAGVRKNINKIFDEMVQSITKDKDMFCRYECELIENDINICTEIGGVLEECRQHFIDAYKRNKNTGIWIANKKMEQLETNLDMIIAEIENDKEMIQFEFVANEYLKSILDAPEALGKVRVKSSRLFGKDSEIISKIEPPPKKRFNFFGGKWHGKFQPEPALTVRTGARYKGGSPGPRTVMSNTPVLKSITPKRKSTTPLHDRVLSRNGQTKQQVPKLKQNETLVHAPFDAVTGTKFGFTDNIKLAVLGKKEIRIDTDSYPCSITGCCFMPSGRLVIVDNNNKNVKLLDTNAKVLSVFDLNERPWDVTVYSSMNVAISCPFNNSVELLSTGLEMKVIGQIKTDRPCHGIGYHKEEKWMYIACGEGTDAQLQAYSMDGHLRKVIIPEEFVFHEPCYLTMSEDCSKLFVSDLDNGIIGFDTKSGNVICQYRDPKIKRYWDICGDEYDRLLTVTSDPDGIYLVDGESNGRLITQLKSSTKPCSIAYGQFRKTLIITRWQSDYIESFQLTPY